MRKVVFFVVSAALCGVIFGCGPNKEKQLIGHYNGEVRGADGKPVPVPTPVPLDLKEDKSFAMGSNGVSGTWSYADEKLTLNATTMGGKTIDEFEKQYANFPQAKAGFEEMRHKQIIINPDGTLTMTATTGNQGSIVFTKQKQ